MVEVGKKWYNISPTCDRWSGPDGLDASFVSVSAHHVILKSKIWCNVFLLFLEKPECMNNYFEKLNDMVQSTPQSPCHSRPLVVQVLYSYHNASSFYWLKLNYLISV